jgi:hypothetical protein
LKSQYSAAVWLLIDQLNPQLSTVIRNYVVIYCQQLKVAIRQMYLKGDLRYPASSAIQVGWLLNSGVSKKKDFITRRIYPQQH